MTAQIIPFPVRRAEEVERAAYEQLARERPGLVKLAAVMFARAKNAGKKTSLYECLRACVDTLDSAHQS